MSVSIHMHMCVCVCVCVCAYLLTRINANLLNGLGSEHGNLGLEVDVSDKGDIIPTLKELLADFVAVVGVCVCVCVRERERESDEERIELGIDRPLLECRHTHTHKYIHTHTHTHTHIPCLRLLLPLHRDTEEVSSDISHAHGLFDSCLHVCVCVYVCVYIGMRIRMEL